MQIQVKNDSIIYAVSRKHLNIERMVKLTKGRCVRSVPQEGADQLNKFCSRDNFLVEQHEAAQEVFICLMALQCFAYLAVSNAKSKDFLYSQSGEQL